MPPAQTLASRLPDLLRRLLRLLTSVQALLFIGFYCFYQFAAQQLAQSPSFQRDDVYFRADTKRALKDITGDRLQSHPHTTGHPNFVILTQPIGYYLRTQFRKRCAGMGTDEAIQRASIVTTSLAGAGTVALFYGLLLANGLAKLRAGLFAAVLGCTATHMFYASTPETYIFSALGLTAVAFVASRRDLAGGWWQFASLYAWSMLTTNIALVGIWSLARYWRLPLTKLVIQLTKVFALIGVIMVSVSLVQQAIYPKTRIFFLPDSVARESGWLYWERLKIPFATSKTLLQHMWMSNIIGPEPVKQIIFGKPMGSIEAGDWASVAPSFPLMLVWFAILAGAATTLRRRSFYTPTILAALGALAFNFAFFFIFGHDRMLYAALWTFTAVMVAAVGFEQFLSRHPKLMPPAHIALALLVAGEAWHNWHFLGKLAAVVQ